MSDETTTSAASRRIHDISRTLSERTATWPGDAPVRLERTASRANGDPVDCGALHATLHAGTHLDAPAHVLPGTRTVDETPLEACLGEAVVADCGEAPSLDVDVVRAAVHAALEAQRAHGTPPPVEGTVEGTVEGAVERVLLRTRGSQRPDEVWDPDFPCLTPEAAQWLVDQGARLVGVDTPSVDAFEAPGLPVHERLLGAGLVILENLRLSHVPPGRYQLSALPLKLAGMDGSPIRAVLWPLSTW